MSVEVKELQALVEREKLIEEKVRNAKEEAQGTIKEAHLKAQSILQAIESDPYWEKLKQTRNGEIVRKKAEIEAEHKRTASVLEKTARENLEKATGRIVEEILRVKL